VEYQATGIDGPHGRRIRSDRSPGTEVCKRGFEAFLGSLRSYPSMIIMIDVYLK
jgi:hypothetical protein